MKKYGKLILSLLCALLMVITASAVLAESGDGGTDFVVLTTTDIHGKCWDTNLLTDARLTSNILHASTAVKQFRAEFGEENVLLIDNGDLYQGNPVSQVQLMDYAAGKSTDPLVMSLCLKEIGYDIFVPGNHEFNYEWETMSDTYRYLEENGVAVLASNICYDGTDPEHPAGENAFTPYLIRTVSVNGHEHKIGILGMENCDITRWDLPINFPGLRFTHPGNEAFSMAAEAALYLPKMKEEGCEMIIVAYHGGLDTADDPLVFGINSESQGERLLQESEDIDFLILGHDHTSDYSNTYVNDKNGDPVLVVNAGGQELTRTVFHMTEAADGSLLWEITESVNLKLSEFETDRELEAKVEPYANLARETVEMPVGTAAGEWDLSSSYYTRQTDTMDLVNGVIIGSTTQSMLAKYGEAGPESLGIEGLDHLDVDISISSVCTSRSYVVAPGDLSMRDLYKLYRYDNNILVLPMSGKQLRDIMEENAANQLKARVYNGEAHLLSCGDSFTNLSFGGINFIYDMSRPEGERVQIQGFSSGRAFNENSIYLCAVNNYYLGNERCGLRIFSDEDAVWSQLEEADGEAIQDLMANYIREYCEKNGPLTPDLFTWHWSMEYLADPGALPPYEGELAATLVSRPEEGHTYALYNEGEGSALSTRPVSGGYDTAPWPAYGNALTAPMPEETMLLTVHYDENGFLSLTDSEGRFMTCTSSSGLHMTEEAAENNLSLWELLPAPDGWYIACVGTEEDPYRRLALEYYGGRYTTYRLEPTGIYLFNFYEP